MTMTIEQLKGMKVAELRKLAVEEGVVYWNAAEKRKMNKSEIVQALVAHFGAKEVDEVVEVTEIQVVPAAEVSQTEAIEQAIEIVDAVQTLQVNETAETAPNFATMKPHEVVKFVKDQASTMEVRALKQLVTQVLEANAHKLNDRRNKLLVRTWSNIKNQLLTLIKIASKRKLA